MLKQFIYSMSILSLMLFVTGCTSTCEKKYNELYQAVLEQQEYNGPKFIQLLDQDVTITNREKQTYIVRYNRVNQLLQGDESIE